MEQSDLARLFKMIDIDYPNNTIAKDPSQSEMTMTRWLQKLGKYEARSVYAAYEVHVTRSPVFAPNWQNLEQILSEYQNTQIPPEEAWGLIQNAVHSYGHTEPREAEKELGKDLWRIVDRFGWSYFCMMPIDEESTYFAQFRNAYSEDCRKTKEQARISPSIAALLTGKIVKQIGDGLDDGHEREDT